LPVADSFEISFGRYKATAEQIYLSEQVRRFRITMRGKYFVLEMQQGKTIRWKIKERSEDVDVDKVIELLPKIKEYINFYLNPPHESKAGYLGRTKW